MARTYTSNIFSDTYRDDYSDSDNYHRILFNATRGVQARELTQMQTIIQKEISRMGNNLYVEGAAINPGGVTCNARYEFIKLNTTSNTLPADTSTLLDTEFTGQTSGVKMKVIEVVEVSGSDPDTLYVYYTDTSSGTSGTDPIKMSAAEDMSNGAVTLTVQTTNTVGNPAVGQGVRVSVAKGDFYVQERFVFASAQSLIVDKYSNDFTGNVGYKVTETIITADDNAALYDNTGPTPDTSAPGADRYQIRLTITDQANVDSDENFVFVAKIKLGKISTVVKAENDYNRINDLLAKRTREESGNYIVKPVKLKFDANDSDATKLDMDISPGLIYIDGYRVEKNEPSSITVSRPRTTEEVENEVVAASFGNYVLVADSADNAGLPNIQQFQLVNLYPAPKAGGTAIGTAYARAMEEDGAEFKLYLMDIDMNTGSNFRSTKSIGTGTSDVLHTYLENSQAVLYEPDKTLLFSLPKTRPFSISDISLTVQRRFGSVSTDAAGAATINLTAPGETFANTTDWIIANADSDIHSGFAFSGSGTTAATLSAGPPSSSNLEIFTYVNKSQGVSRTKTLKNGGITIATGDWIDSAGVTYALLDATDIYSFDAITKTDSDGNDVVSRFRTDTGQRDNFYDLGRVLLRSGQITPNYDVHVQYQYFKHGTSGDFFSVSSYSGQVDYENIPSYKTANGTVLNLRSVLDFRPVKDVTSRDFTGVNAVVNELPANTNLITADVTYYQGRKDILTLNAAGELKVIAGAAGIDPQLPNVPETSLPLYNVSYNPYVVSVSDLDIENYEYRHYTMASIGKLEDRIVRVEEATTLSLLELNTNTFKVLDSAGLDRTKSGFFVDNFVDHTFSDISDSDYRASIDPQARHLRPAFVENNIGLVYDSDLSTNTIKKGDNVYAKYTLTDLIDQDIATTTENVNPFATILHQGPITLSPQSDEWRETRYEIPRVIDNSGEVVALAANQERLFNNNEWNWSGVEVGDNTTIQNTERNTIVSRETVSEITGDRLLESTLIPFIRSRKVYFEASGLRPNTEVFAFFDGEDVASWVRAESFTQISDDPTEYGNLYDNATTHPETNSTLTTDANGTVEGSFFIPNTDAIRFRTGERIFKLLDVTADNEDGSTSLGKGLYVAKGILDTRQQDIRTTRQGKNKGGFFGLIDPLAQSFFVEENAGLYVTRVDLYFSSKAVSQPVAIQIRTMENGVPTSTIVPGTTVVKNPSAINISADATSATNFTLIEPIYLMGGREYAICVLADTTEYNVFTARMGDFVLGSTEKRVTKQPFAGVLFKSANNRTWSAYQTEDLMFKLKRAVFSTDAASVVMENAGVPRKLLGVNPFLVENGSATVRVTQAHPGMIAGDTVNITGVDSAVGGISISSLEGARTVVTVDDTGFTFAADSAATDSDLSGGSAIISSQGFPMDIVYPSIQTLVPENTSISAEGKFMTGKSLAGGETAYTKDVAYTSIRLNKNNIFSSPRLLADSANELANLGSNVTSATIKIDFATTSDFVSPMIDMQRASLTAISNAIDFQDSASGNGVNVPIKFVNETNPDGGSHASKHLTKVITLEEGAVGLKVLLGANVPSTAAFDVYYRTASAGDTNILDNNWVNATRENNPPQDNNPATFRDYEYLIGGKSGSLDEFIKFQLKLIMKSTNTAKVPVFKDLRVIALSV